MRGSSRRLLTVVILSLLIFSRLDDVSGQDCDTDCLDCDTQSKCESSPMRCSWGGVGDCSSTGGEKIMPCTIDCGPTTDRCRCGVEICDGGSRNCGFVRDLTGTKHCFTDGEVNAEQCWTRAFLIVGRILCILYLLLPAIVLVMLAVGAIVFAYNADNPEKRKSGKNMIKNAIIGAIIVLVIIKSAALIGMDFLSYDFCYTLGLP